jgi:phage shock protein C
MKQRTFYRSTTDKKIAGVCGGIAEYFAIDPSLVRALFIVMGLCGGAGVLLYVVLWMTVPGRPASIEPTSTTSPITRSA